MFFQFCNKILISGQLSLKYMNNERRSMPICFTPEQIKLLEDYAKKKGMLNSSQAIEHVILNLDKN